MDRSAVNSVRKFLENAGVHLEEDSLRWTAHIRKRLVQRSIQVDEVIEALANCEIIAQYPDDYPFPTVKLGYHTLCWDNGVDFAPEYLYEQTKLQQKVA